MLTYKDWTRYIVKRLLLMIPILLGISLIIFSIMEFTPGDPVIRKLGTEADPRAYEMLREKWNLNAGFLERYFIYIKNIVTKFEFGSSWRTDRPVWAEIGPRVPVSLRIASMGIVVSVLFGIPLGIFSAVKQNTVGDNVMRVLSTVLVAVPGFWLGMLLILLFALRLGLLPASDDGTFRSYIMPVLTVGLPAGCRILRITRSTMLESIREDYVRTAKSKGVPNRIVTYRHALQNALLPVVTTVGTTFGLALGGATISESVFSMNGMGSLIVMSVRAKDTPTVMSCVLVMAAFFSIVMLLVDILMAIIDPRVKAKIKKG